MIERDSSSPQRVLVVERDARLGAALVSMLVRAGYEVSLASNDAEAMAIHGSQQFDILIADTMLQELGGLERLIEASVRQAPPTFITISSKGHFPGSVCFRIADQLGTHCIVALPYQRERLLAAAQDLSSES